ncbi:MAG: DNA topoisomerase [Clostridia bacterium]
MPPSRFTGYGFPTHDGRGDLEVRRAPGRPWYDRLYESARCRSEADWLVGINGSRAYTIRYGALLSIGRVQTPTLALLVSRQAEIDSFVPKDYFEVHLSLKTPHSEDSTFSAVWFELEEDQKTRTTKIWERGQAEQILQNVMRR